MDDLQQDVITWLHGQQDWLQEAAEILLRKGAAAEEDLIKLTEQIKTSDGQAITSHRQFVELISTASIPIELRLTRIENIQGIENLAPRKPLIFGTGNLTVIFGNNGSGKSSYTKILKNITGKSRAESIRHNVFQPIPKHQKCDVSYMVSSQESTQEWFVNDGAINNLKGIDIFDSDEATYYLSKESPATYTPPLIGMFEELAKICDSVKSRLQQEQGKLTTALPMLPAKYSNTDPAVFYNSLKPNITTESVCSKLSWLEDDEKNLTLLTNRLKETDPEAKAKQLRATKLQVELFIKTLQQATLKYKKDNLNNIDTLREQAEKARRMASEAASVSAGIFEGIGSETWRAMWEAARAYSQASAYPTQDFPVIENAHCVLCHQELSIEAQLRLREFETFIQGKLEAEAKQSEVLYSNMLSSLPLIPTSEQIETQCEAAGLGEDWKQFAKSFWESAGQIRLGLLDKQPSHQLEELVDFSQNEGILQKYCIQIEGEALQFEKDSQQFNRAQAEKEKLNLEAKYFISQQIEQVQQEILRLKSLKQYDKWITFASSRSISTKASVIADAIITDAYVKRFNQELTSLGATRLRVELVKTKAQKGKSLHRLQLKSAEHHVSVESILSEGERRIISLAAFLADVIEKPYIAPFIFDDPISSLDQTWEEKTIERLVALSQTRQVIVFTHRLSMLGMLSEKADEIHTIHIRQEPWGAGESGEVPLYGKKPESALKNLQGERVSQARKIYDELGQEAYYPLAKAICSDLRILTERIVECVFLADVIQRHRRAVNTQGKIHQLAKISVADCDLIEEIMTKYSCYEHSQSPEAPVELPTPDELNADITKILVWHNEFSKRAA